MFNKFNKKSQLTIKTLFYILMGIIFVFTLIYGIEKVFFVKNQISQNELLSIKENVNSFFDKCSDPLNKGNTYTMKLYTKNNYNSLCVLGEDKIFSSNQNLNNIYSGLNNYNYGIVVLGISNGNSETEIIKNLNPITYFKLNYKTEFKKTLCFTQKDNNNFILLKITCS